MIFVFYYVFTFAVLLSAFFLLSDKTLEELDMPLMLVALFSIVPFGFFFIIFCSIIVALTVKILERTIKTLINMRTTFRQRYIEK